MARGRPRIGTPEEAAERRRRQTAERVRRFRERRRAEKRSCPMNEPAATEAAAPTVHPTTVHPTTVHGLADERLRYLVERIERLEKELSGLRTRNPTLAKAYAAERRSVQEDLGNTFGEAKKAGFDVEALREVIRLRKIPPVQRIELERTVNVYKQVLGMR